MFLLYCVVVILDIAESMPYLKPLPASMRLKIKTFYDSDFHHLNSHSFVKSRQRINRILADSNQFFTIKSDGGLGTVISFEIVSYQPVLDQVWSAVSDMTLQSLGTELVNPLDLSINLNLFFSRTSRKSNGKRFGISYNGSVCHPKSKYRVIFVKWHKSDFATSLILAHEIGHSLDMNHDFMLTKDGQHVTRFDLHGSECSGIHGIMDYGIESFPNHIWSSCSQQDLVMFYNQELKCRGKFCLENNQELCMDSLVACSQWTDDGKTCQGHPQKQTYCAKTCKTC